MAHISLDTIRKRLEDGGTNAKAPEQSTEESLQPLGSDDGVGTGELERGDGTGGQQTDTANDVVGSSNVETKTKSKS